MIAVVAADLRNGIGREGGLLCHLPGDLAHFRELTMGKTVILGRRTLATFPGGKPLAGRRNIVLTRDPGFTCEGAVVCHSVDEVLAVCADTPPDGVCVIGGGTVYAQFLPHTHKLELTRIARVFDADTFFPFAAGDWVLTDESDPIEENGIAYRYCTYTRTSDGCCHPAQSQAFPKLGEDFGCRAVCEVCTSPSRRCAARQLSRRESQAGFDGSPHGATPTTADAKDLVGATPCGRPHRASMPIVRPRGIRLPLEGKEI